jgi:hypothetical protein
MASRIISMMTEMIVDVRAVEGGATLRRDGRRVFLTDTERMRFGRTTNGRRDNSAAWSVNRAAR